MSEFQSAVVLRIGACLLHPRLHQLQTPDREVQRLPKRLVELLVLLANHAGRVLGRDELLDKLWQRRNVADEVLSRTVADLRLALGDDARAPRYIETIPKTGYRLVAEVEFLSERELAPQALSSLLSETTQADSPVCVPAPTLLPAALPAPATAAARNQPTPRALQLWLAILVVTIGLIWLWLSKGNADQGRGDSLPERFARARPLTSDQSWEMHPATSSDGVWLAYARAEPFGDERKIHLRHLARGQDRVWAGEAGFNDSPAFSPDGSELVYRYCEPKARACEWRRRALDGGEWQVLADAHPLAPGADWSPLGIVAVISTQHAEMELAWLPVLESGASWRELDTQAAVGTVDQMPRFIPGTREVAVIRSGVLEQSLLRLSLDQPSMVRSLSLTAGRIHDHRWPAADEAWLSSDALGFRALLRWRPKQPLALLGARGARGLALLPSGGAVMDVAEYDSNLHLASLSGLEQPASLIEISTRSEGQAVFSPDGHWLASVSLREGRDQVWLKHLETGELRRVSPPSQAIQAVRPAFSHDGKSLYFTVYSASGINPWRYDLNQRTAFQMTQFSANTFALHASSLADNFVFAEHLPLGDMRLWRADSDGRIQPIEAAERISEFKVEGSRLWWRSVGQHGWQRHNLENGETVTLQPDELVKSAQLCCWAVSEAAIFALYQDRRLYRLGPEAGAQWQSLGRLSASDSVQEIAVHAASKQLIFNQTDRISVDLFQVPGT